MHKALKFKLKASTFQAQMYFRTIVCQCKIHFKIFVHSQRKADVSELCCDWLKDQYIEGLQYMQEASKFKPRASIFKQAYFRRTISFVYSFFRFLSSAESAKKFYFLYE